MNRGRGKTRRGEIPVIRGRAPRAQYVPRLNSIPEENEEAPPLWAGRPYARRVLPFNQLLNLPNTRIPSDMAEPPTEFYINNISPPNLHIRIPPYNRYSNPNYLYVSPPGTPYSGGTRKRRAKKSKTKRWARR